MNPKREITIGRRIVEENGDAYVIAEVGHNHQGSLETAKKLFESAHMAGVDAVKLQKRDNPTLYTKAAFDKPYENENSYGATYGEHREFLEFGEEEYRELIPFAHSLGMDFICTAFDFPSVDFLANQQIDGFKIASGDLTNTPLQKAVAGVGKPIILSTGGGSMEDIQRAVDTILPLNSRLCILHCTATYPTMPEDMNLRVIESLRARFPELIIGLSDHYDGISMAPVAYVLGARIFEKHFTLHHTWKGTDHAFSLEPIGMHKMTRDLHRVRAALGNGVKTPLEAEKPAVSKMGKSVYASHDLSAGATLTEADLVLKSPGGKGFRPFEMESLIGRRLRCAVPGEEALTEEHLEA